MRRLLLLNLLLLALICGCTRVGTDTDVDDDVGKITTEPYETVLILMYDRSGSMVEFNKPGGKGFEVGNRLVRKFLMGRAGGNDLLVIGQLSGNKQVICWQGSPRAMREDDLTERELGDAVIRDGDNGGSRLWDGLSDVLELSMRDKRIWNGKTKVILAAMTDLENTLVDSYSSEKRIKDNLKAFAKGGGAAAFYFVKLSEMPRWTKIVDDSGFRPGRFVVAHDRVPHPDMPSFE